MNELLLHTIWKYKLLSKTQFIGTQNESIDIVSIGEHNQDSGPDFFNSKIRINQILLVGNVEIHVKTSDWLKHQHQLNKVYDNLVLHVVYEHDIDLHQNINHNVSVLELKQYITPQLLQQYYQIQLSKDTVACGKSITQVNDIIWKNWIERLAISRIQEKTDYIEHIFLYTQNNHEEALHILLFRNFGFKINNEPFELLAKSLPFNLLKKYINNAIQIEALLYGVAGFLDDLLEDKYARQLQNEFEFLKHKHQLKTLKKELWKFSKTRPINFPTIRIAQLANLITKQKSFFHFLEEQPNLNTMKTFFELQPNTYWNSHYKFDVKSEEINKPLGDKAIESLVINTIVPYFFFMSKQFSIPHYIDYALDILSQLPSEINSKTKQFKKIGICTENALESQAQIYLLDNFCSKKRCLHCAVGQYLLKNNNK